MNRLDCHTPGTGATLNDNVKDLTESARVAAQETAMVFRRLASAVLFVMFLCMVGGGLVGAAFFVERWLAPHLSINNAVAFAVMTMILPIAAIGWFGIIFSVEFEQRRKDRG